MRVCDGCAEYELRDLERIPRRAPHANKGSYGHVLVIAGSAGMSGAAYLSALSAYRTGAGVVRILTPEANRTILQTLLPEAIVTSYTEDMFCGERKRWKELLSDLLQWSNVVILGPGLSGASYVTALVQDVMEAAFVPLILDADALLVIAKSPFLTGFYTENIILTPHVKEFSELTKQPIAEILSDMVQVASKFRDQYGVTLCLKSHESVTAAADGTLFRTVSGTPALAKAGSGDVLTGVIAGLICLGFNEGEAASFGSFLHGLAGQKAAEHSSAHGVLAREVADAVPLVMRGA